jgi:hypothetical protein
MRGPDLVVLLVALGVAGPACAATDVVFSGTVSNTCTLAVPTPGLLGLSADGKTLGSEETGGLAATVTVVSLGGNSITVGAPSLVSYPGAYTPGSETLSLKYQGVSGLSGISQAYTSAQTSFSVGILPITNLIVNLKVVNNSGFAQGAYSAKTVLTCS